MCNEGGVSTCVNLYQRAKLQEPMFIPRPHSSAEDDGWVLVAVHNAESLRGEITILDAQR